MGNRGSKSLLVQLLYQCKRATSRR